MLRIFATAAGLALTPIVATDAAPVTQTLNGAITAVDGSASGLEAGDPVTTVFSYDDSLEVVPGSGIFELEALSVRIGDVVLTESDDTGFSDLQVDVDDGGVSGLVASLAINEAAFGFAAGELVFEATGDVTFNIFDPSFIPVVDGTVVPVPAALPLLATGVFGLAWLRRRAVTR